MRENMTFYYLHINTATFRKIVSIVILTAFIITSVKSPSYAQTAQEGMLPRLPQPGVMVHLSPEFTSAHLQGITIHPDNALQFDFLIRRSDQDLEEDQKKEEYKKLVKYFLASLTIPDEDQWVNLSPYEKDRIIKDNFGKTEMGRDLLAEDYLLKQITSSLIYPEDGLGKKFWDKIYERAWTEYHTANIPVNTFNKVWIVPDQAYVYESGNTAYILKSHLKVMLEEDYLSLEKHSGVSTVIPAKAGIHNKNDINAIGSQVIREIILPELEKEVNEGKNFANLRQMYSGMILATWYKKVLKESLLGKVYADKAKVKGVDQDPKANEAIYQRYLKAFKKGVFNYIREDVDKYTNEAIPRKYFSGGWKSFDKAEIVTQETNFNRSGELFIANPATISFIPPSTISQSNIVRDNVMDVMTINFIPANIDSAMISSEDRGKNSQHIILVAEDDKSVAKAIKRILTIEGGFKVEIAGDGDQALGMIKPDPKRYLAVLTDYNMPKMNGLQLTQNLISLNPTLKVVMHSGDDYKVIAQDNIPSNLVYVLEKPDSITQSIKIFNDIRKQQLNGLNGNGEGMVEGQGSVATMTDQDHLEPNLGVIENAHGRFLALRLIVHELKDLDRRITINYRDNKDLFMDRSETLTVRDFITKFSSKKDATNLRITKISSLGNFDINTVSPVILNKFTDHWINGWSGKYENEIIEVMVKFKSGLTARTAGNQEVLVKLAENPDIETIINTGSTANWMITVDKVPEEQRKLGYDWMSSYVKKIQTRTHILRDVVTDIPGMKVAHGTLGGFVSSVKLQGPINTGQGVGGVGLYLDIESGYPIAKIYAALARGALDARKAIAEVQIDTSLSSKEQRKPVIMIGHINPSGDILNKRVTEFEITRDGEPDLEHGRLPMLWADDPNLQAAMLEATDILDLRGMKKYELNLDTNRILVVHQSAGNIFHWEDVRDTAQFATPTGGIDFNSVNLNLQIKRDGKGVPLPLAQQDMAQLSRIQGFEPEIIEIKPALNVPIISELQQKLQISTT
jgi:CheY-like chemotaxis protein